MRMNIGIWYDTYEDRQAAIDYAEQIAKETHYFYFDKNIRRRCGNNEYSITNSEGDRISVIKANDCGRGQALNISYVPIGLINSDLENIIIRPCTKMYPRQIYHY